MEEASALPCVADEESEVLDFKRSPWASTDSENVELARDVAQFANHLGGSIVVGADELEQRFVGFVDVADRATLEKRVMDTCYARLSPRAQLSCLALTSPTGNEILVINIQPSVGPVGVRVTHGRWDFFRRHGKGKKPMEFEEVEQMWSDARRGRILLSRVPTRASVHLDASEIDPALARAPCQLQCLEHHFQLTMPNSKILNLPYEYVRATCPRAGGGWYLAVAVRFQYDMSASNWLASHVF